MYHRDHISRFVATQKLTPEQIKKIGDRANTAIAEFSNDQEGVFAGSKIEDVLGSNDLVRTFKTMWEKGKLFW